MAITLKVVGNGHFSGSETNLSGYSVDEDATPIEPSDSSGGTGVSRFTVTEDSSAEGTILLRGDTVEIEDGSNGRTKGTVTSVAGSETEATINAGSRLNALVLECTMLPFAGTLEAAFRYYLSIGGITSGIVIDPVIGARIVALPAWTGNLWDHIKKLCIAEQMEVSLVSSNIVLRPLRQRIVETVKNTDLSWSVDDGSLAQTVEIYYHSNTYVGQALVYPVIGETAAIMQVDTNELSITEVKIDGSIMGVMQPDAIDVVPRYYTEPISAYSVIDSKGNKIPPLVWKQAGGGVTFEVGEDLQSVIITVIGASLTENAPYRLAGIDPTSSQLGEAEAYSSIRVVAEAIVSTPQVLTLPTGMPLSRTGQVVGVTVDNPFISTLSQAYTTGLLLAGKYAGAAQTINVSATVVNRKSEPGSVRYPTFAEFDAQWVGKTFAQFTAANAGKTFAGFTAEYFALVADTFENQAFGNVVGARVRFREAWYRIRSSTVTNDIISYSAERDTLISDFNSVWAGATFADFNAKMVGKTFEDFGVIPLWR